MVLTAPQEASVVTVANSAELAMPKRTSLPSMLPPACKALAALVDMQGGEGRVAAGSRPRRRCATPARNSTPIDGEDRPALALVADHAAEHVGQRRADREDQHHLR